MTKKPETRLWACEFGAGYAVPEAIDACVEKGALTDNSWHNDVMPSFIRRDGLNLYTLWVDHPEKDSREFPERDFRFGVYHCLSKYSYPSGDDEITRYEGNDLDEALAAILNTNGTEPSAWMRNRPSIDPDSHEWSEEVAKWVRRLDQNAKLKVDTDFPDLVTVLRISDETDFHWGQVNPKWGADVHFPWNEDGDVDDSVEVEVASDSTDLLAIATAIWKASTEYECPPEPDTPAWFDQIVEKVKALPAAQGFNQVESYHSGGGMYGVAITRADGAWLFWGVAGETWGAGAYSNEEQDNFQGNVETGLSSRTKDLQAVAALIVTETLKYENPEGKRLDDALEAAQEAFWASVVKSYPESVSGDFGPHETAMIESAMKGAIRLWVQYNVPSK